MTTVAVHVHEVDKRNRVMLVGWCVCGEEYDERRGKWRAPRLFDGMRRRFAWDTRTEG